VEGENGRMYLPDEQQFSYLIIGNGIAGITAAETLRAEDPQASIGIIADDPSPVYYRPALKDYLGGHVPTEKLWARRISFYRDTHVSFLPDRVIGLDSELHMVLLQSQKPIYYHKLLLANGASPARLYCPGNDLYGVTTLRTVTDYQNVLKRLKTVRRVVISGSGTLALETAESLHQRGIEVTHLLRGTMLWSEVLDTTASDLVLQEERRAGVEVCLEEEIVKITGRRGAVSGVITNQGRRISCQMVIVAIGIKPNIKPWELSGVSCGRGVRVDDALRTNLPDIYAAGDLIETHDKLTNRTRVLGQWYPAIQQARSAAYSMLGRLQEVEPFGTKAFYNATFLYGLDFASAGLTITPDRPGYRELVADPQPQSYRKVILKNGIPVGLLTLGNRRQALALKRAMDHRVNLLPVASRLFSADFNLRAWLDEQIIGSSELALLTPTKASESPSDKQPIDLVGTGGERIMIDRQAQSTATMQTQEMRTSPIPTNSTDHEALLVHIVDPALHLHIAETPLSHVRSGQAQGLPLRIGRQAGVHLLLDEGSVSRQHAEISYNAGHYLLCDLGSTNGTFVNEQRLEASRPYALQPNDVLRFGNIVRLKFLLRVLSYQSRIQPAPDQEETRRDSALRQPNQHATVMPNNTGGAYAYQKQPTTGQAFLNRDGTLSTPGNGQPVPVPIVEQLKKAPALVIIPEGSAQNGIPPQIHFLNPGKRTTIGRENDNDIVLTDTNVSPYHAEVFLDITGFHIRDLSSRYGTLVNQTKVLAPYLLTHSDRIKLGSTRIFFIDLQAGKEPTIKSVGVNIETIGTAPVSTSPVPTRSLQGTLLTQNNIAQQRNILICSSCGIANARVARFCASCSALL
jgi:NADPH-dependent 2,4-dienoyl-CoA reductase/sulfur reductase-like enzyme/pSer/pThr/pTyr-binding forkhead associated (FHA) protein